jgi:hypothetical protein
VMKRAARRSKSGAMATMPEVSVQRQCCIHCNIGGCPCTSITCYIMYIRKEQSDMT